MRSGRRLARGGYCAYGGARVIRDEAERLAALHPHANRGRFQRATVEWLPQHARPKRPEREVPTEAEAEAMAWYDLAVLDGEPLFDPLAQIVPQRSVRDGHWYDRRTWTDNPYGRRHTLIIKHVITLPPDGWTSIVAKHGQVHPYDEQDWLTPATSPVAHLVGPSAVDRDAHLLYPDYWYSGRPDMQYLIDTNVDTPR